MTHLTRSVQNPCDAFTLKGIADISSVPITGYSCDESVGVIQAHGELPHP